jgi:hypothetical protein
LWHVATKGDAPRDDDLAVRLNRDCIRAVGVAEIHRDHTVAAERRVGAAVRAIARDREVEALSSQERADGHELAIRLTSDAVRGRARHGRRLTVCGPGIEVGHDLAVMAEREVEVARPAAPGDQSKDDDHNGHAASTCELPHGNSSSATPNHSDRPDHHALPATSIEAFVLRRSAPIFMALSHKRHTDLRVQRVAIYGVDRGFAVRRHSAESYFGRIASLNLQ